MKNAEKSDLSPALHPELKSVVIVSVSVIEGEIEEGRETATVIGTGTVIGRGTVVVMIDADGGMMRTMGERTVIRGGDIRAL